MVSENITNLFLLIVFSVVLNVLWDTLMSSPSKRKLAKAWAEVERYKEHNTQLFLANKSLKKDLWDALDTISSLSQNLAGALDKINIKTKDNETLQARLHQLESELGYANARTAPKTEGTAKGRKAAKAPKKTHQETL